MPNYIKNRIEIIGDKKQVKELVETLSTFYPKEQSYSHDGKKTFKNQEGEYGWLDEKSNLFSRQNQEDVQNIPEGFEPVLTESFTRFPDFEKIIPMPESLNIASNNWLFPLENQFSANTPLKSHLDQMRKIFEKINETEKEKLLEGFISGVRNYIEYGHATWYSWSRESWGTKWNSSDCKKINDSTYEFTTAWNGVPQLIKKLSEAFPKLLINYEYSDEDTGYNCGIGTYYNRSEEFKILEGGSKDAYELAFKLRPDSKKYYKLIDGNYKSIDEEE